jgi:hypothetical protein
MFWIGIIVGYAFAVIVGHFAVKLIVDQLWQKIRRKEEPDETTRPAAHLPQLIGVTERALYVASIQAGFAEFIGVWLALKVAGKWKRWGEGIEVAGDHVAGRIFYNIFLIGSGFSIGYSAVGALMVEYFIEGRTFDLLIAPVALLAFTCLFWLWIRQYQKKEVGG